jgi:hypothetical protein
MTPDVDRPTPAEYGGLYDPGLGETLPEQVAEVGIVIAAGVIDAMKVVKSSLSSAIESTKDTLRNPTDAAAKVAEKVRYWGSVGGAS